MMVELIMMGMILLTLQIVINTILTNPETGITQDITKLEIEFTFVDENGNTIN